jgi:outer membrane cobalamin receptor
MVRTRTRAAASLCAAAILVFFATSLSAQTAVVVSGAITDVSGATLPGATVETVIAGRAVASAVTAEAGRYRLDVPAGVPFELRVRRDGFADVSVRLTGATGDIARDVTMQIRGTSNSLVVTASRGAAERSAVTESVTVANRADIEALGVSALADVLRFVPGLSVEGSGREGAVTSVFARGGESDYNLVLVDGVRVNANGGGFDFSRISASEIERVEVVRGAQSALWGSDAMGSVVQIFTGRTVTGAPQPFGTIEGGSFNTWRGDVHVAGGTQRQIDYQAGVTYRRSDGAFDDILPQEDWFEQSTFDGRAGVKLGTRASLRTSLRASRAQARSVGNVTFGSRDTGGSYDSEDVSWHTELSHTVGRRFTGTASFNYFHANSLSEDTVEDEPFATYAVLTGTPGALYPNGTQLVRLIDEGEFNALASSGASPAGGQFLASAFSFDFPFESRAEFRRPALRYQGDLLWANGQRFSAGYEWERETNPLVDDYGLQNNAFFVQQQSTIAGRWFVTAGVRVDARESYDTFVSPKVSAGGFVVPARDGGFSSLKVFGSIGRGVKTPGFAERFGDVFADPSPDLKAERARTADLGAELTFVDQRLRTSVTYFNNAYRDQVAYRFGPTGDGVPEYINIDGSDADGWEFEAGLQRPLHGVSVSGTYSYVDTRVVAALGTSQQFQPGQPLLRRPRHSGSVRAGYSAGRVSVHGDVLFIGDRHDNSFLFFETLPNAFMPAPVFTDITVNPGYVVAGAGVDVRLDRGVTAFFRINNLADTEFDAVIGYPGMPRTMMAGARVSIGK